MFVGVMLKVTCVSSGLTDLYKQTGSAVPREVCWDVVMYVIEVLTGAN